MATGGSQGVQGPNIGIGMVAEPSLADLLQEVTGMRARIQGDLTGMVSTDIPTVKGGFEVLSNIANKVEEMMKALNRRLERSEAAIITGANREIKKYQGDAGNHKAIHSLKILDANREKFC